MGPRKKGTGGQPSPITQVVRHDEQLDSDGHPILVPITMADQVVERVRVGLDLKDSAASAGLVKQTIWEWRRKGALNRALQAQGKPLAHADGLAYIAFVDALERAESEAELLRLQIIQGAAEGGFLSTKVVTRYAADGTVVERVTTEETQLPQWTAAAWWLERRMPRKYQRRAGLAAEALAGLTHALSEGEDEEALRAQGLIEAAAAFSAEE